MGSMSNPFTRRVIIVSGKGGVGKSTVAAAIGVAAARLGKKTLITEVAGQETMAQLLGGKPSGYNVVERRLNLYTLSITPARSMQEYLVRELHSSLLYQLAFKNRFVAPFINAVPGLDDLVTIGKVMDLERTRTREGLPAWDIIVVDGPATGQGINLLRVPKAMMDMTGSGPFYRNTKLIHDMLIDPEKTLVYLVTLPEEMPVNETLETYQRIQREIAVAVGGVIVNHLRAAQFSDADLERLEAVAQAMTPPRDRKGEVLLEVLESLVQLDRRARLEHTYLARLEAGVPLPTITLPALPTRDLGPVDIDALADHLAASLRVEEGARP